MWQNNSHNIHGIRIGVANIIMIVISCILYIFLVYTIARMPYQYNLLIAHTDEYIACEESASMVTKASDYLTEQVRLYVQNMDTKYMDAYFEEANVTRRREKALEQLRKYETDQSAVHSLESALQGSIELMNREIYAMKLISLANNYLPDVLPEEVNACVIGAEDEELTPEQMVEKARDYVFNDEYQDAKALIYSHLSNFTDSVTDATKEKQTQSIDKLGNMIEFQRGFITLLFIMNTLTFLAITILIVRPLRVHIRHIKENKMLDIVGSYEFKYLAFTYNDIYKQNSAHEKMLTYRMEHDPLTGLFNRAVYDRLKMLFADSATPIALILLDVDNFKQINDTFGHKVGDSVLRSAASILKGIFRSEDYVIRLGGDEFVIIMKNTTAENSGAIKRKFEKINQFLQTPEDELPATTFSAGVGFSEHGFSDKLFSVADEALYIAKNKERKNCCCFYDEIVQGMKENQDTANAEDFEN